MCSKRFCLILSLALLLSPWAAYSEPPSEPQSLSPSFETLRELLTSIESEASLLSEESAMLSANLRQMSEELSHLQTEQLKLRSLYEARSKSLTRWKIACVVLGLLSVGLVVVR